MCCTEAGYIKSDMALELDIRTAEITGETLGCGAKAAEADLRQAIEIYTEKKLLETAAYAKANSGFYAEKLAGYDCESMDGWEDIPFSTPEELRQREKDFLCVRPSEISRIVTLKTSGTTGRFKRIYFTEEDQQLTVDFFDHGMRLIVDESDTVLILMPASSDGSIGKLLGKGLRGAGVNAIEYGLPFRNDSGDGITKTGDSLANTEIEAREILQLMREKSITSVVAVPAHMAVLAEAALQETAFKDETVKLRSALLSADFVSEQTVELSERAFGCRVFEHYGMTEMGLGCAVSCGLGEGYHIREADIFVELIDPVSGAVIKGEASDTPGYSRYGEIVFTTLTRKGMPFIRYRTGDGSRWILKECPCGSRLKRLDKVVPEAGRR